MDIQLKASYAACEAIAKERAGNFYYAFSVLPKAKRRAICAVYAFMRYCDDISDSERTCMSKMDGLAEWRSALDRAMVGDYGQSAILPAFHDAIRTFRIPDIYFRELIEGATMDLSINRYLTFEKLYEYCYKVASVVGLVCIHIFGFNGDMARRYAEYNGIAFQLTNILRDVREDSERDRIYLPLEDLAAAGYTEEDLLAGVMDDRFKTLMQFEVGRARGYYDMGAALVNHVDLASRPGLTAMIGIYHAILDRIEERGYDVFSERIALTKSEKLGIAARSVFTWRTNGRETTSAAK